MREQWRVCGDHNDDTANDIDEFTLHWNLTDLPLPGAMLVVASDSDPEGNHGLL